MKTTTLVLTCVIGIALALSLSAQDANVIPFQGQLASQSGQPLTPTSPSTLVFRLYRQAVGGIAIWEESQPNISVSAGRFSVLLGSRTELPAAPNFNTTLYLGITVDDGNPATADVEMRPRQALVPVTFARVAGDADKLGGFGWSSLFDGGSSDASTGKIAGNRITPGSIMAEQLTPASVNASILASNSVGNRHLADGVVTQSKLGTRTNYSINGSNPGVGGVVSRVVGDIDQGTSYPSTVANSQLTLTTSGRPVLLLMQGEVKGGQRGGWSVQSGPSGRMLQYSGGFGANGSSIDGQIQWVPYSHNSVWIGPAGTYVFELLFGGFAFGYGQFRNVQICAFEL